MTVSRIRPHVPKIQFTPLENDCRVANRHTYRWSLTNFHVSDWRYINWKSCDQFSLQCSNVRFSTPPTPATGIDGWRTPAVLCRHTFQQCWNRGCRQREITLCCYYWNYCRKPMRSGSLLKNQRIGPSPVIFLSFFVPLCSTNFGPATFILMPWWSFVWLGQRQPSGGKEKNVGAVCWLTSALWKRRVWCVWPCD